MMSEDASENRLKEAAKLLKLDVGSESGWPERLTVIVLELAKQAAAHGLHKAEE